MSHRNIKKLVERYDKQEKNPTRNGLNVAEVEQIINLAAEEDGSITAAIWIAWRAGYIAGQDHEAKKHETAGKGAKQ